ncbi:hypothetical protein GCM10008939_13590 [Deinococcus aquiradiocola]|uniref:GGDEF domain-containing protein n=1 Tax=Deinococcus aquiradiocola TaxID=393059 RepID=A0A917PC30_9DEIO|nr:hypothetical protein GCM10008939_13590 [Deinococcus aquiradiocola]
MQQRPHSAADDLIAQTEAPLSRLLRLACRALQADWAVLTLDAPDGPWRAAASGEPAADDDTRAVPSLACPVTDPSGRVIGEVRVGLTYGDSPWQPDDRDTLHSFAQVIGTELDRQATHRALQRERLDLQVLTARAIDAAAIARALGEVTDLASLDLTLTELLTQTCHRFAPLLLCDWAAILHVDADGSRITGCWHADTLQARAFAQDDTTFKDAAAPLRQDDLHLPVMTFTRGQLRRLLPTLPEQGCALAVRVSSDARHSVLILFARLDAGPDGGTLPPGSRELPVLTALQRTLQLATDRARERADLVETRDRLRLALEAAPLVLWATDLDGTFTLSEGSALQGLNARPGEAAGHHVTERYGDTPEIQSLLGRIRQGERFTHHIHIRGRTIEARFSPLTHPDGTLSGSLGVGYDVTDLVQSQEAARQERDRAEALLELFRSLDLDADLLVVAGVALKVLRRVFGDGWLALWQHRGERLMPVALHGDIPEPLREYQQRGFSTTDGYAARILTGQSVFLDPDDLPPDVREAGMHAAALLPVILEAGEGSLVLSAYRNQPSPWSDGDRQLLTTAARTLQISMQRHQDFHALQVAASSDALTGLGNRRAYQHAVRQMRGTPFTVVLLDLDGLKRVNDQEGHHRGDALLIAFAAALRATFRPQDELFRLGGDEFVVLMPGTAHYTPDTLQSHLLCVTGALHATGFVTAGVSAGAASSPRDAQHPEDLLRLSDERMYAMKQTRR